MYCFVICKIGWAWGRDPCCWHFQRGWSTRLIETPYISLKLIQMCCSQGTIRRMNPRRALKLVTLERLLLRFKRSNHQKPARSTSIELAVQPEVPAEKEKHCFSWCPRRRRRVNGMASVSKPDTCIYVTKLLGTTCYFDLFCRYINFTKIYLSDASKHQQTRISIEMLQVIYPVFPLEAVETHRSFDFPSTSL